jgi:general transcription factor 3C polypeptide 3 (transcription factor C subunit 4)
MAFFTRYRKLRQADAVESDEVEYNFGRAFQQLGGLSSSLMTPVFSPPPQDFTVSPSSTMNECSRWWRGEPKPIRKWVDLLSILGKIMIMLTSTHQDVGLAREAAFNLSLIYVTTGASRLAEDMYRRWLTL